MSPNEPRTTYSGPVATAISTARKRKGWTQGELAEQLGIRQQSVSKWESGVSKPDGVLVVRLNTLLAFEPEEVRMLMAEYWPGGDIDDNRFFLDVGQQPGGPFTGSASSDHLAGLDGKIQQATDDERAKLEAYLDGLFAARPK